MTARWLQQDLLAFDLETTGVDTEVDRLVTACCARVGSGGLGEVRNWLANPGIEIPLGATAVHGITTAKAVADGEDARNVVERVSETLRQAWKDGLAVVVMNAPFDLSMLAAELRRYEWPPLQIGPVLDPLVIDRAVDPYRKGKRNLTALAEFYGVKQGTAHSAEGDALTAARIVWAQAKKWPLLETKSLASMQTWQTGAQREWAKQFGAKIGKPVDGAWPVRVAA